MVNTNRYFLKVCFLTISILLLSGCGGSSSAPAPDPDPEPTSSAEQAALASDAVVGAAIGIYSQAVDAVIADSSVSVIAPSVGVIKADGIEEASECAAGTAPSFTGEPEGGTVQGSTGGSCVVLAEMLDTEGDDDGNIIAKLDCTEYDNGDGLVFDGIIWIRSDQYGSMSIVSDGLTLTTSEGECPLIINMTVSGSGNTATANGCISSCGSAYAITNRTQEVAGYCAGSAASGFSSIFNGSCTYVDGEPSDSDTFSYTNLVFLMDGEGMSAEDQLLFMMVACHLDSDGGCMTMAQIEAVQSILGSGGGGSCNATEVESCFDIHDQGECESSHMITEHEGEEGPHNCYWRAGEGYEDDCVYHGDSCSLD